MSSDAKSSIAITRAACVHRTGELGIGELAVWVGVSAAHRDAAFAACRWIIDEVKARVPIWKQEHYEDGDSVWSEGCSLCGDDGEADSAVNDAAPGAAQGHEACDHPHGHHGH